MAADHKDTIYIDIDDEITTIIDKVRASSGRVVALVLPKRATMLQSIVNMKLLKRAAEATKKNIVLITTESGLLPLAGAVGLHVAKTPSSRPEIPTAPQIGNDAEEQVDEVDLGDDDEAPLDYKAAGNRSIGDLAAGAGAGATMPLPAGKPAASAGIETLELDNADAPAAAPKAIPTNRPAAPKKNNKLKVPDFDRFRLFLTLGIALLAILVVGGYFAFAVLPEATIDIKTNASNVNTNVDFTLSTTATSLKTSSKVVPAQQVQTQKTYTGTADATGQQNNGDKATGSVTMTLCTSDPTATSPIPAGSGVNSGSKTYITQERADFQYSGTCGKNTFKFVANSVSIKAQSGGAAYNVNKATFKVSGRSDISAIGSADGGTDDIQTVVSQADIDSAKGKINADTDAAQNDLKNQLQGQGLYAIASTYNAGSPTVTTSSKVGDAANSVTVTEVITYTMLGASQDDLNSLIDGDIKSQIDTSKQGILSRGLTDGSFRLGQLTASGATMNVQTVAEVGPSIDTSSIASNAAGKKAGDIKNDIKSDPDVTDVTVKLSPFWVTKAPKNTSKITVNVAKPTSTVNAD